MTLLCACLGFTPLALAQMPPEDPGAMPNVAIDRLDYQGNLRTTDRFTAPAMDPEVEVVSQFGGNWEPGVVPVSLSHVAYVKGATASIKIRINNCNGQIVTGSLTFTQARLAVPGPSAVDPGPYYLPLTMTPSSFIIPPNSTVEVTTTVNGLPAHVAVGGLQVKYDMPLVRDPGGANHTGNNGTNGNWEAWQRICILDATPIGLQAVPWTDFLEYTCRWAYGASGSSSVREEMTKGIHFGQYTPFNRFQYDPGVNYFWDLPKYATSTVPYLLSLLLWELGSPLDLQTAGWIQVDCRDINGLLQIALSSQGVNSECVVVMSFWTIEHQHTGYYYWPLCRAGNDPSVTWPIMNNGYRAGNYRSSGFNFHVIVESDSLRYDSAASYFYKHDGSLWGLPAFHWDASTYWQSYNLLKTGHAFSRQVPFNWLVFPFGAGNEAVPQVLITDIHPSQVL